MSIDQLDNQKKQGFTLVELMVVISIITILAVVGMTLYNGLQGGARDAKRRGDIKAISAALEIYKQTNGTYPLLPASGYGAVSFEANWDTFAALLNPYMLSLPKDPQNIGDWGTGKFYKYHTDTAGSFYQIAASLEDTSAGSNNFTFHCATALCTGSPDCNTVDGAHKSVSDCTFNKTKGGFGYDSQQ